MKADRVFKQRLFQEMGFQAEEDIVPYSSEENETKQINSLDEPNQELFPFADHCEYYEL
jgi:hypothetical protein